MTATGKFPWLEPFEQSGAAICLRDAESILLWVNAGFADAVGRSREELIGMDVADLFAPSEVGDGKEITATVIRERRVYELVRGVTLKGVPRWFEIHHSPVSPERTAGHGWCALAHAVEVTANVQMAALRLLLGLRQREARKLDGDERFVRLLLQGATIRGLSTALQMSVDEVTGRLSAMAGTPLG